MTTTVADVMVATLKASGVRRIYGIPGDSLNGFTDALRRDGSITWEHVRHEEAAGFASAAEAALTGELAVCAGSCGPGNLHLINGLFDANRSRVPVLAIASHIPSAEIGGGYFQETHPQELFRECSVYCEMAGIPEQLPRLLQIAMRAAVQRGGVAVVVVPGDVLLADAPSAKVTPVRAGYSLIRPDEAALAAAAEVLNAARAVTILAGAGPGRGGARRADQGQPARTRRRLRDPPSQAEPIRWPCSFFLLGRHGRSFQAGQRPAEFPARGDAQLDEHLTQVPLDRPRADEQLGTDFRIGIAGPGEPGDLGLLGSELVGRLEAALAHVLAGRQQLAAGSLGEPFDPHRGQPLAGGPQRLARFRAAVLAAQPFAVQQVRAGQFHPDAGAAESLYRLAVQVLGGLAAAEQRP